ncbi:MAG TPA: chromate efflux transporter [Puia sp.]|nr:chromate efflux transporter [Puia sp.]
MKSVVVAERPERTNRKELARLFLKLGITAFGGPAAHIAMMQKEVVEKRRWMDHQHFLDLIGATNLIPGPNSTEMAIHIGHERGGWKGLLIAGLCFILPAVLITGFIAWLYQRYGQLPQVTQFIYGIKPAIIAIILAAALPLARRALKTAELAVIGLLSLAAALAGINEIYVMFGAGLVVLVLYIIRKQGPAGDLKTFSPFLLFNNSFFSVPNLKLFLIFLKIGAILYGSGYVLFAFLDRELVAKGLLTRSQLVDAIAVGQFTPGPVFSSVTFIGWQMNGWQGAVLATIAIFLPSFLLVALLNPLVPRMRRSALFGAFLDGVNVASVAIIATVCVSFGRESLTGWRTILIALLSGIVSLALPKVNTVWVVVGSGLLGYVLLLL